MILHTHYLHTMIIDIFRVHLVGKGNIKYVRVKFRTPPHHYCVLTTDYWVKKRKTVDRCKNILMLQYSGSRVCTDWGQSAFTSSCSHCQTRNSKVVFICIMNCLIKKFRRFSTYHLQNAYKLSIHLNIVYDKLILYLITGGLKKK